MAESKAKIESQIAQLVKKRGTHKSKLTSFCNYLKVVKECAVDKLNASNFNELKARLEKIEYLYSDFDVLQGEIEELSEDPEVRFQEREAFESQYYDAVGVARALCDASSAASSNATSFVAEVSVVFHSAATVKLHEALRTSIAHNVLAVESLLRLADRLPKLRAFVHVSTAFSNAEQSLIEERVYRLPRPLPLMVDEALAAGDMTDEEISRFVSPKPNTYIYSKAMSETAVAQHGPRSYPVAIFRPTVVVSSLRHPFPGWVDSLNGPSGVIAGVARGALRVLRCEGTARLDLLPVDIAIDTLIAVAWETAVDNLPSVRVYNCSTSDNPTDNEQLRQSILHGVEKMPSAAAMWQPSFCFVRNRLMYKVYQFFLQTLPLYLAEYASRLFSSKKSRTNLIHVHDRLCAMTTVLEYFWMRQFAFTTDHVRRLRARLSRRDAAIYNLDPNTIDWKTLQFDFVKGTRRHLLNEKDETIPAARQRMQRIYLVHRALTIIIPLLLVYQLFTKRYLHSALAGITALATALHASCTITGVHSALAHWLNSLLFDRTGLL